MATLTKQWKSAPIPTPEEIAAATATLRERHLAAKRLEGVEPMKDMARDDIANVEFITDRELAEYLSGSDTRWTVCGGKEVK